jgi:hypothetical protein
VFCIIIEGKSSNSAHKEKDMEEKKALKINLDELCTAIDNSSYELDYYLDLSTGEVIGISEYMDDEASKKLKKQINREKSRYEPIPKAESREGYQDMEDFIASIQDEHLSELLEVAITGKGAFRRFKDVLLNHPEQREMWFKFSNGRAEARAMEWLDDIGVILVKE